MGGPSPMPEHWFRLFLANSCPPGDVPHRSHGYTMALWRASMSEVAAHLWREAFIAGEARGAEIRPMRMEIACDQRNCRLAELVRKD